MLKLLRVVSLAAGAVAVAAAPLAAKETARPEDAVALTLESGAP